MAVIGSPRSFHKKFQFTCEIDDVGHTGFQKCSALSVEVANVQYFEGGSLITRALAGSPSPTSPSSAARPRAAGPCPAPGP